MIKTMKYRSLCAALMLILLSASSLNTKAEGANRMEVGADRIAAGTTVSSRDIEHAGVDNYFYSEPIPDAVFARMRGKSYKSYCTVKRQDLRYIRVLHYNIRGEIKVGELVCHKSIAADLVDIFRNLYRGKYPIEKIGRAHV